MEKLEAGELYVHLSEMRRFQTRIELSTGALHGKPSEKHSTFIKKSCAGLMKQLRLIGATGTLRNVAILAKKAEGAKFRYEEFDRRFKAIDEMLRDELSEMLLFALGLNDANRYRNPLSGWEEIVKKLPSTLGDIEEAQKCFALSRYAASVFHSVQVVEFGLIALGEEIGTTDPHSGWTAVTNKLNTIQKTKHGDRSAFEKKYWSFLEQITGTVEALKNAWRNKVSHAHGKLVLMTADFSPEIAEEILMATRAFMRRLTTDGPLASPEQPS
jgi:hypothetical protein